MEEPQDNRPPLFYNRVMVFVFTLFLGAFFGSLLYARNLQAAGKRSLIAPTIIVALFFNFLIARILAPVDLHTPFLQLWTGNLVAALILTGLCWNYHFKDINDYNERSVIGPLLLIALVYSFFIYMNVIRSGLSW